MLDPFEGMKQDIERTHARRQRQWEFSMKMAFGSMVGIVLVGIIQLMISMFM
jgi:hypothetical protein